MAALPQWGLSVKLVQLLGLWGPWWSQVCRYMDCLHCRSYGPNRVFFQTSCSWRSEDLFGQSFSVALPIQALRGLPCLGSLSVVQHDRHREGPPQAGVQLCRLAHQALKGAPWVGSYSVVQCIRRLMGHPLYCSGVGRERLWWGFHPPRMTQQYCLVSMAAWLSSTGISHHNLLPHIPCICLSTVNSSSCPGIAPQSLNSSSQLLHLPGDLHPCPGYVWLEQGLSDSHSI